MKPIGLYLHVPFCKSKCDYCDFYSLAGRDDLFEKYTLAVIESLGKWGERLNRNASTLYFGGGTPSLLSPEQIGRIIKTARENFSLTDAEITLECNPSTIYDGFFDAVAQHGVNRISLGLQSANLAERRSLGRKATPDQAQHAVQSAQKSGIHNISLDLMLALPHQTRESLAQSVRFCADLGAKHISAYILKAEEGTPFAKRTSEHPDDDFAADMYLAACEMIENYGYKQYEISNFCKDGFESRHNLKYWLGEEYLGLGPAAHSFLDGKRFCFERNLDAFLNGAEPIFDSAGGDFEEFCMLRLRLADGLKNADTQRVFGFTIPENMLKKARALEKHTLTVCTEDSIRLTKQGFLLSNAVILEILS
ncbi:MAG: radical SAM family heme chaperone HemW [Clostridia bacterium]|nr:radical SAM family heme chaperone HemW [Clostridia bacterium]